MPIKLPEVVLDFFRAHNALKAHYAATGLAFTLDGKLVGDIGEAVASEAFGLVFPDKRIPGVDAFASDHRSVQIKATGRRSAGPAFTPGEGFAQHLLFLRIDFAAGVAHVAYNGPEARIRAFLPTPFSGTITLRLNQILAADALVKDDERLLRLPS
jgi:hypothetical protein